MDLAVRDVISGANTLRRAALEYGVPRSTLSDRVTGKVCPGAVSGAPRYLDDDEEEELVEFLIGCAEVGYPKSVREVRAYVDSMLADKYHVDSFHVSHGWWERFRQRHKQLSLRMGESLSHKRAIAMSPEVFDKYFDLLEETLQANKLNDKPALIFNCDESGVPLSHRPGKRVAARGQKHVHALTSDTKTHVTVLACVNASGYAIPPMIIYRRANLSQQLTRGEVGGTMYGLSPSSGWIDGELFSEWFDRHFLLYAPSARPLLLLLDGHSSHYNPQFIRHAAEQGVIIFLLPPNTTHVSQPLDGACFKVLKGYWNEECSTYMARNPGKTVTIYQFSELFANAWVKAMTPQNIIASFRMTGVFPVNREAISIPRKRKSTSNSTPISAVARKNGIGYLPLYSPAPRKHTTSSVSVCSFTDSEMDLFEKRYKEGYDVPGDTRYEAWLDMYHHGPDHELSRVLFSPSSPESLSPTNSDNEQGSQALGEHSPDDDIVSDEVPVPVKKFAHILKIPTPVAAKKGVKTRGARVLTSSDFLTELEEKERLKREKEEEKARRKRIREEKAREKAANKAEKAKKAIIRRQALKARKQAPAPAKSRDKLLSTSGSTEHPSSTLSLVDFTHEEIMRYQRRFEEGYDVPDARYEAWKVMQGKPAASGVGTFHELCDGLKLHVIILRHKTWC